MGMDLYGKSGNYFRNNYWWWRPLWNYALDSMPADAWTQSLRVFGGGNNGRCPPKLFNKRVCKQMIEGLKVALESGRTAAFAKEWEERRKATPQIDCDLCGGTGKREDMEVRKGCNVCEGTGKRDPSSTWYPFSEENVREFVAFLEECEGGLTFN